MGHPAPFNLKFLGIGNEQWGPEYPERLKQFVEDVYKRQVQLWQLLPGVIVCAALELYLCSKGQAKAALAACAVLGLSLIHI